MSDASDDTPQPIEYDAINPATQHRADLLNEMHAMWRTTERHSGLVWVVGQAEMAAMRVSMHGTPGIDYNPFTRHYRLFGIPVVETKEERGHGLYVRAGRVGKW